MSDMTTYQLAVRRRLLLLPENLLCAGEEYMPIINNLLLNLHIEVYLVITYVIISAAQFNQNLTLSLLDMY